MENKSDDNIFYDDDSTDEWDSVDDSEVKEKVYASGKRISMRGLKGRNQYVVVDDHGIMITFPDNHIDNLNYQATATALTRIISIALQAGVCVEGIKKQLGESSMQKRDTPHILLNAIEKYQGK